MYTTLSKHSRARGLKLRGDAAQRAQVLIAEIGGPQATVDWLDEEGIAVDVQSVRKWQYRAIPWKFVHLFAERFGLLASDVRP